MNKKNIIIILTAIVLIGGLYFFTMGRNVEDIQPEDNVMEDEAEDDVVEEESEEDIDEDLAENEEETYEIAIGEEVPPFTLKNLDGEEVSIKDYRGKIVLINFWGTWCPWCDKEMPDLQKLYEENKDEDFVVLAVDVGDEKPTVEKYIKDGGYTFPVVLDEGGKVSTTYLVSGYPSSYFVDEEGKLLFVYPGMLTYPQMNELLERARGSE